MMKTTTIEKTQDLTTIFHFNYDEQQKRIKLGEGSYSKVYSGIYQNKAVAIKLSRKEYNNLALPIILETFENEINILERIKRECEKTNYNHERFNHLVMLLYLETFKKNNIQRTILIFDLFNEGTLKNWKKKKDFTWEMRYRVLKDVATGLACLHELNPPIVHCDIKADNIFLYRDEQENLRAKIGDFGLAKEENDVFDKGASKLFADPQYLLHYINPQEKYLRSREMDIWAFGLLIYCLFEKRKPYYLEYTRTIKDLARLVAYDRYVNRITIPDKSKFTKSREEIESVYDGDEDLVQAEPATDIFLYDFDSECDNSNNNAIIPVENEIQNVFDQLKSDKREIKNTIKQAKKANMLSLWCCQFERSNRPKATELEAAFNTSSTEYGNLKVAL